METKLVSGRELNFPECWLQRNVTQAEKKGSRKRAKELADRCVAGAVINGITI
jgi:hypothetical protein